MNRLAPLVRRRTRPRASFHSGMISEPLTLEQAARWAEDAKLFATGWLAGLVIFGTLIA